MFASHQVDRVGVGVKELAEQVEQADLAGNCARLRREEPQRHAATIIGSVPAHRKHRLHPPCSLRRIEPAA
jgi:hypothetical protein